MSTAILGGTTTTRTVAKPEATVLQPTADSVEMEISPSRPFSLRDTVCVACGSPELQCIGDLEATAIVCPECFANYDIVDNIPCLVRYQSDEALSLLEILSGLDMGRVPPTEESYRVWARVLNEYHDCENQEAYLAKCQGGIAKFLPHRYRQYKILRRMLEDTPLAGRQVLDVGAGEGFDSAMLSFLGCKVTAIEFSPISASLGRAAVPTANWFCGSVHALPFEDESFDVVVCQAALHHFADVPAAIREMLRVLKVGGQLMTISDSYRSERRSAHAVVKQFNNDPAVLRGVNEGVPCIRDYFEALHPHLDCLGVEIFTSMVYNFVDASGRRNLSESREWKYPQDYESLRFTEGGMSLRVSKHSSYSIEKTRLTSEVFRPSGMANKGAKKAEAMAALAQKLPSKFFDLELRHNSDDATIAKFQLLNGWRLFEPNDEFRSAYSRCRWFLTKQSASTCVRIEVASPAGKAPSEHTMDFYLGGTFIRSVALPTEHTLNVELPLDEVAPGSPFAVEMRLMGAINQFEEGLFCVKSIELVVDPRQAA